MKNKICGGCNIDLCLQPEDSCHSWHNHISSYISILKAERDKAIQDLDTHDDIRDKLDVADWLRNYNKTKLYDCSGCGRHYEYPTHLTNITCVCGLRARLRHLGGINPDHDVIDAAIEYFGTERSAQLAYIAEVIVGKYCENYSAEEIRKMFQHEMDRWEITKTGWVKKK